MLENARGKPYLAKFLATPLCAFSMTAFANEQQLGIRNRHSTGSVSHPNPNPSINHPGNSHAALDLVRARSLALQAGFTEAGLVTLPYPETERDANRFSGWIGAGRAATMRYLERVAQDGRLIRARVETPFPWARSAIVCFASYASHSEPLSTTTAEFEGSLTGLADQPHHISKESSTRSGSEESSPGLSMSQGDHRTHLSSKTQEARSAWVARYAWSSRVDAAGKRVASDYHKVLLKRLKVLESRLHEQFGAFESRAYVDTGPVVERPLAVAAGLGWTGKNTCLIHPKLGSFGFLAVLLTSLDASGVSGVSGVRKSESASQQVSEPAPAIATLPFPDRCGSCTRCIQACPTNALDTPYQMDANRCIAYLTIEHKGPIDESLMPGIGRQVFGCDICQDVCPWNSKSRRSGPIISDPDLSPRPELVNPTLDWLGSLDEQSFERLFNGSPVRRTGFNGLRRNIAVAMGNSGLARFIPSLAEWADAADDGLRQAARWALNRLRPDAF
jgi:epoxyqueuosine reductase